MIEFALDTIWHFLCISSTLYVLSLLFLRFPASSLVFNWLCSALHFLWFSQLFFPFLSFGHPPRWHSVLCSTEPDVHGGTVAGPWRVWIWLRALVPRMILICSLYWLLVCRNIGTLTVQDGPDFRLSSSMKDASNRVRLLPVCSRCLMVIY